MTRVAVAATTVSRQRTALVDISADRHIVGTRLLGEAARAWDSRTPEDRVKLIAAAELELDL